MYRTALVTSNFAKNRENGNTVLLHVNLEESNDV